MPSPSPPAGSRNFTWLGCELLNVRWCDGACGAPASAACRATESRTSARRSPSEISIHVHVIDDTNDCGVNRRRLAAERLTGGATLEDNQHLLVHPGADAVDGQQGRASRFVVRVDRLDEQQLRAPELPVFLRRHAGADAEG